MALSGDVGIGPWFGILLVVNAVFLAGMLVLVAREHSGKLNLRARCLGAGQRCLAALTALLRCCCRPRRCSCRCRRRGGGGGGAGGDAGDQEAESSDKLMMSPSSERLYGADAGSAS